MTRKDDSIELLIEKMRWLRLPGMVRFIRDLLVEAAKKNLTPLDVVDRLCDEERKSRTDSAIKRRIQEARFPQINTVGRSSF